VTPQKQVDFLRRVLVARESDCALETIQKDPPIQTVTTQHLEVMELPQKLLRMALFQEDLALLRTPNLQTQPATQPL
jgi:hypothetical protein